MIVAEKSLPLRLRVVAWPLQRMMQKHMVAGQLTQVAGILTGINGCQAGSCAVGRLQLYPVCRAERGLTATGG